MEIDQGRLRFPWPSKPSLFPIVEIVVYRLLPWGYFRDFFWFVECFSEGRWLPGVKLTGEFFVSFRFEEEALSHGARRIAGIDEAGRGPLAGPVVAAAVIMHASAPITEVNDSKLLTAPVREALYTQIMERAASVGIGIVSSQIIDEINIYQATKLAMQHAIAAIDPPPDYLLIDGNMRLPVELPQLTIVKGDRLSFSVAAAGIVAKVTRDRLMRQFHDQFPHYGFDKHKGYATKIHREAILQHGPCPIHRVGFKGVKQCELPLFSSCNQEE